MQDKDTRELLSILNNIESKELLDKFIEEENFNRDVTISDFFNWICNNNKIKKSELIRLADIDRTYGYQILNGTKSPSRNNIIKLCIAAKLDLKGIDTALAIGNECKLYPRRKRDSLIIFGINKGLSLADMNEFLYDNNEETL